MSKQQDQSHINELERVQMAEHLGKWYGWGSPIGLSIFFLTGTIIIWVFVQLGLQLFK